MNEKEEGKVVWPRPETVPETIKNETVKAEKKWYDEEIREPTEFERLPPLRLSHGLYRIKILTEPRRVTTQFQDKTFEKIVFNVQIGNERFAWFVTIASTTASLYGQLCQLAKRLNGLVGKEISVNVTGAGKLKRYSVISEGFPTPLQLAEGV